MLHCYLNGRERICTHTNANYILALKSLEENNNVGVFGEENQAAEGCGSVREVSLCMLLLLDFRSRECVTHYIKNGKNK